MTRTYGSSRGARRRVADPDDDDEVMVLDESDDEGHGRDARPTQNTQNTQDEEDDDIEEYDTDESDEARRVRREEKKRRLEERARRKEEKRLEKSRAKRRRETMEEQAGRDSEPYIEDVEERKALMTKCYAELDVIYDKFERLDRYETVRAQLDAADDQVTEEETNALLHTVNEFRDVPVTFAVARDYLIKLGKKYTDIEVQIDKALAALIDTAKGLETVAPDHEEMDELQADIVALLQQNAERKIWNDVVEELLSELQRERQMEDLANILQKRVRNRLTEYNKLTTRAKLKDDEDFIRFRTVVWEVHHEEDIPPITRWLSREEGDPEDDDIEFGGSMLTFRCPITLTTLQDACKSTVCGHHYSYDAIMHHIQSANRNRPPKCPYSACPAILTRACIRRDPELQQRTDKFIERQRRREEMEAEEL